MEILLVGNSKSLLWNEHGEFIDSHPIVVRFNNYETKGYEKHVGSKTDWWCMRACDDVKLAGKKEGVDRAFTFVTFCKYVSGMIRVSWAQKAALGDKLEIVDQMACALYAKDMGYYIENFDYLNEWPSIGALAISHFTSLGHSIKLIGFSFEESHYFNKPPKDGCYHKWEKEAAYVRQLKNVEFVV